MENEENSQDRAPRLPKGRYRARAMRGQLGNSSEKGTPQVVVDFKILDEEFHGEYMPWIGYFTDATEERTLESLRVCGWKGDDLDNLDGISDNEVELVIDHERDLKGVLRARVQWVNRLGGFQQKAPMSSEAAKSFAAKMRGKAAASRVKNGGSAAPATEVPTTGPDGKPLPF